MQQTIRLVSMNICLERVRGISFDAAFTLLQPHPSVGHVYARIIHEQGYGNLEPSVVNRGFAKSWKGRRDFDYSEAHWFKLVEQTLEGLLTRSLDEQLFRHLYDGFRDPACWLVYEDVRPSLKYFRERGMEMVVTSNWDTRLRQLLRDLDLDGYFREIIVSAEVGFYKPDPRIFQVSCDKLGCRPQEALHVGDTPEEDMEGAKQGGLQGLLINRSAAESTETEIRSLENLTELFKSGKVNKSG
ncbi:MAG: HAD-superfamily hydrolase, subfamily variant 1 [Verrucomicrobiales bacterium]|nr:HAD-superfamily hydrolase, subfamily variant 1 [Verrucomicrobiales bacterium]